MGRGVSERVAVVTGAVGGIGSRLMVRLAEDEYTAVGLDLPDACAGRMDMIGCDITDETSVLETFATIRERYGRIDLLVNNAGISAIGGFTDHDLATYRRVMDVNYLGAVACTRAALPDLKQSRGRVVVISSVAGFAPVLGRPAYVGAKHAVTGLFDALRVEWEAGGVGVTLVHPTFVTGGMGEAADRTEGTDRSTSGPEVTSDDVARAVVEGVARGRDRVLVGRTAHLSYHLSRLAPGVYARLMKRRLTKSTGSSR